MLIHARSAAAIAVTEALGSESSLVAAIGDRLVVSTASRGVIRNQLVTKLNDVVTQALRSAFPAFQPKLTITLAEHL